MPSESNLTGTSNTITINLIKTYYTSVYIPSFVPLSFPLALSPSKVTKDKREIGIS